MSFRHQFRHIDDIKAEDDLSTRDHTKSKVVAQSNLMLPKKQHVPAQHVEQSAIPKKKVRFHPKTVNAQNSMVSQARKALSSVSKKCSQTKIAAIAQKFKKPQFSKKTIDVYRSMVPFSYTIRRNNNAANIPFETVDNISDDVNTIKQPTTSIYDSLDKSLYSNHKHGHQIADIAGDVFQFLSMMFIEHQHHLRKAWIVKWLVRQEPYIPQIGKYLESLWDHCRLMMKNPSRHSRRGGSPKSDTNVPLYQNYKMYRVIPDPLDLELDCSKYEDMEPYKRVPTSGPCEQVYPSIKMAGAIRTMYPNNDKTYKRENKFKLRHAKSKHCDVDYELLDAIHRVQGRQQTILAKELMHDNQIWMDKISQQQKQYQPASISSISNVNQRQHKSKAAPTISLTKTQNGAFILPPASKILQTHIPKKVLRQAITQFDERHYHCETMPSSDIPEEENDAKWILLKQGGKPRSPMWLKQRAPTYSGFRSKSPCPVWLYEYHNDSINMTAIPVTKATIDYIQTRQHQMKEKLLGKTTITAIKSQQHRVQSHIQMNLLHKLLQPSSSSSSSSSGQHANVDEQSSSPQHVLNNPYVKTRYGFRNHQYAQRRPHMTPQFVHQLLNVPKLIPLQTASVHDSNATPTHDDHMNHPTLINFKLQQHKADLAVQYDNTHHRANNESAQNAPSPTTIVAKDNVINVSKCYTAPQIHYCLPDGQSIPQQKQQQQQPQPQQVQQKQPQKQPQQQQQPQKQQQQQKIQQKQPQQPQQQPQQQQQKQHPKAENKPNIDKLLQKQRPLPKRTHSKPTQTHQPMQKHNNNLVIMDDEKVNMH